MATRRTFAVHQKISRNPPRNPAAPITRRQPSVSFFFTLRVRARFSSTLLRFISLNACVSLVRAVSVSAKDEKSTRPA